MDIINTIHDQAFSKHIDIPVDMQGWNDNANFIFFFDQAVLRCDDVVHVVEVGSWKGLSACIMAERLKINNKSDTSRIIAIDTWLGSPEHMRMDVLGNRELGTTTLYHQFLANVMSLGFQNYIYPFPISGVQGGHFLEQNNVLVDIIYIDAGHEFEAVALDIVVFWRVLKPGGTLILDDYAYHDVQRAVQQFALCMNVSVEYKGTVACIVKPTTATSTVKIAMIAS
jgi:predicted O-methyltransferase YrrM